MKKYIKPELGIVQVTSNEAFSAYSGCVGDTFHAAGLGTPVCSASTPDHKDGDCWYTPHA